MVQRLLGDFTLLGITLILSSCATARVQLVEANFQPASPLRTSDSNTSETIAFAGVINRSGASLSGREAETILSQAAQQIEQRRRRIDILRFSQFQRLSSIDSAVLSGRPETCLSSRSRTKLSEAGIRFLYSIELTSDRCRESVRYDEEEITKPILDEEGKEVGCKVVGHKFTTTSVSTRSVAATVRIYDLEKAGDVWVVSTHHAESHTNSNTSSWQHPPPPPHPAAPCLTDVVDNLTSAALRKLPRAKW
ncbi:MAG: hypothetical protein AAF236_00335 [Verrucomicrobiota bacterium]